MSKLKLGVILDEKSVKLTIDLPAVVHRDLLAYAEALDRETGQKIEPGKLVAPMLARFMSTDRAFIKARRASSSTARGPLRNGQVSGTRLGESKEQ